MFITCLSEMWQCYIAGKAMVAPGQISMWSCATGAAERCEAKTGNLGSRCLLGKAGCRAISWRFGIAETRMLYWVYWCNIPHDGSMVLLKKWWRGSHQYTPFMLAYMPAPWILWVLITYSEETSRHDAPFEVQGSPLETKSQRPRRERPCWSFIDGLFSRITWLRWFYRHIYIFIYLFICRYIFSLWLIVENHVYLIYFDIIQWIILNHV